MAKLIWNACCHRLWWSSWKCCHRNSELGAAAKMGLETSSKRFPATTRTSCMSCMTLNVENNQHVYVHHKCQISTVLQCTLENILENGYKIKEGLKRTTSWGWKVLCKDIWINLGIDTDSRHNCLWFLVWCDWGPLSWSMCCSPLKKTFVWLTKTYPKEEKFNKLNWLPQSYCEQRPNCSANPNPQKSCSTGKKMRLSRKKRILVAGSGWHVRSKRDGGKKEEIVAGSGIWKPYYIPS